MKNQLPGFVFALLLPLGLVAQDGGAYLFNENSASEPCITEQQYQLLQEQCALNCITYHIPAPHGSRNQVTLNWPLRAASNLLDCSYYWISAHVDQDSTPTNFKDYNCGSIAYDGHGGTDIAIGPFPFHKMDSSQVEVIAAADGTIIDKHDGEFDKLCPGKNTDPANYIVLQHSDGSRTFYWHMKKNSLTQKKIGDAVTQGEFLGNVGSSGYSSGPHLHFEVWAGSTKSTRVDPFSGSCNHMNSATWWANQKPYTEPSIIKASTHITDIPMVLCPDTQSTEEATVFNLPFQGPGMTAGYAKFYIFYRNETKNEVADLKILNPDGSEFTSWSRTSTADYKFSYWGFSKKLPTTAGVYTFQASYNGQSCSGNFEITTSTTGLSAHENSSFLVQPNPCTDQFTLTFSEGIQPGSVALYTMMGQLVRFIPQVVTRQITLQREALARGIYMLQCTDAKGSSGIQKIVIE